MLLNYKQVDVVDEILKITGGRGVDASIECLGTQRTFNQALRVLKPGGTLSSLGVYSDDLQLPVSAIANGLGITPSAPRCALAAKSGCAE